MKSYGTAQHFDRISTDTDIGDSLAVFCCADKKFAQPASFNTLTKARFSARPMIPP